MASLNTSGANARKRSTRSGSGRSIFQLITCTSLVPLLGESRCLEPKRACRHAVPFTEESQVVGHLTGDGEASGALLRQRAFDVAGDEHALHAGSRLHGPELAPHPLDPVEDLLEVDAL